MKHEGIVYDKASYHEEILPPELPERQASLHIGVFLGWLIERGLVGDEIKQQFSDEIESFRSGRLSAPDLFAKLGGVLADDMLTDDGNRFAAAYYDRYLRDYQRTLAPDRSSPYYVDDSRENYERMRAQIDAAFERWQRSRE